MNTQEIKKEIFRSLVFFGTGLALVGVTYAAISWPTTPSGETAGGKYSTKLVPSTAVMAFYASTCPTGWSVADGTNSTPDLRGAFVRGMNGNANGRDSARALWNYQADGFQGHFHAAAFSVDNSGLPNIYPYWSNGYSATAENSVSRGSASPVTDDTNGEPRYGNETRPKNIALLYCIKD